VLALYAPDAEIPALSYEYPSLSVIEPVPADSEMIRDPKAPLAIRAITATSELHNVDSEEVPPRRACNELWRFSRTRPEIVVSDVAEWGIFTRDKDEIGL